MPAPASAHPSRAEQQAEHTHGSGSHSPKGRRVGAHPRWQRNHRPFLRERKEKTEVRREKI